MSEPDAPTGIASAATDMPDAPRRTHLAAERTWLAWWRTGLAAAGAAIGIGRVLPELIDGTTWPYVVLGAGYGVLALGLMGAAAIRQAGPRRAPAQRIRGASNGLVLAFTAAGMGLALFTVVLVVAA